MAIWKPSNVHLKDVENRKKMNKTKLIAFHLPQFHTIPENDEWWGEGFTDWVNVKKAKSLYNTHNQPRVPLNNNYYDLSDVEVMRWQSELAKEYGVYGFCYYHYWFGGKLLLQKPLENLLKEKDIDFPFCLCWANETWCRTWDGGTRNVLIQQEYGGEKEWKEHFEYLKDFFLDSRYIRVDNKPVIVIYRSGDCECFNEMIACWRELCPQYGIDDLYVIDERNGFKQSDNEQTDALLDFEPFYSLWIERSFKNKVIERIRTEFFRLIRRNTLHYYSYDNLWKSIINRDYSRVNKKIYTGAFVDWDNTPRRKKGGIVVEGASPEKFAFYLEKQLKRANSMGNEFVFINAWNEWAEGTYLEPDEKNEYKYLNAIRQIVKDLDK